MKTATIQTTFDEEKLAALKLYLGQKNMTVEGELQAALTNLFQRHVPSQVRDFFSLRGDGSPEPVVPKARRSKTAAAQPQEVQAGEQ